MNLGPFDKLILSDLTFETLGLDEVIVFAVHFSRSHGPCRTRYRPYEVRDIRLKAA
jgi:hypothetical protein